MPPINNRATIQHYVPRLLLRRFTQPDGRTLQVFDKRDSATFATNYRNVAAERRFYDLADINGDDVGMEQALAALEALTEPVIAKILEEDTTRTLHDVERLNLADFIAVQFTRTRAMREQFREFPRVIREQFGQDVTMGGELVRDYHEDELVLQAVQFILEAPRNLSPHILGKRWLLLGTDDAHPFLIGDNPVTLQNSERRAGPLGNLGVAVRGIEVYLPLTPTRVLAMWCPSIEDMFRTKEIEQAYWGERGHIKYHPNQIKYQRRVLNAIATEGVIEVDREHVENHNSLQIAFAERFVFSKQPGFDIARRMIARNPAIRTGLRSQIV